MKKLFEYLKIGLKTVGKFLKFAYAAQLTIAAFGSFKLALGILIGRGGKVLYGLVIIAWAVLLAYNEYKQDQIPKV